jgi:hypothetical protein
LEVVEIKVKELVSASTPIMTETKASDFSDLAYHYNNNMKITMPLEEIQLHKKSRIKGFKLYPK